MDSAAAEDWIRDHVRPTAGLELAHERPWSTVLRVPVGGGAVWFKACAPVQAFEPRLSAQLYGRWPDRVGEVLALDEHRGWLLLADAGSQLMAHGNPPEAWLDVLAGYAELQRAEAAHASDHLAHRVPDLRMATLPGHYDELVDRDLPVGPEEQTRLRAFAPRFAELCAELDACGVPATVQHDDLHMNNVFVRDAECRVLDWGDASIGHPFASIVVTFRFLEEINGLVAGDPWFARLRDAYLEPWGQGLTDVFELAVRVGTFAHLFASTRVRGFLAPDDRPAFDVDFRVVLRRALRQLDDSGA